jgi:hypothetical protein
MNENHNILLTEQDMIKKIISFKMENECIGHNFYIGEIKG